MKSARGLGYEIGLNAHQVNETLEKAGLLERGKAVYMNGSPVWEITEKGKEYGKDGYWSAVWDESVLEVLKEYV